MSSTPATNTVTNTQTLSGPLVLLVPTANVAMPVAQEGGIVYNSDLGAFLGANIANVSVTTAWDFMSGPNSGNTVVF